MKNEKIHSVWNRPLVIAPCGYIHKSLAAFNANIAVGCDYGCTYCQVPGVSVVKQTAHLEDYNVQDPDAEWGKYVLYRPFDEQVFLKSLMTSEMTPLSKLLWDGHRAVMYCTMTDPYQTLSGTPDSKALNEYRRVMVRRSLELIRDCSTLNVRILTRSPLAKVDFALFKSFGSRLMFGMSLSSVNDAIVKLYEPKAPSVIQRLKTLKEAAAQGLNVFVAIAPTFPECDESDLRRTFAAIAPLNPVCVYHEPINIRADNVERMKRCIEKAGKESNLDVFLTRPNWVRYSMKQLVMVQRLAGKYGLLDRLKLWPDPDLEAESTFREIVSQEQAAGLTIDFDAAYRNHLKWLRVWWNRLAPWPGAAAQENWQVPAIPTDSPCLLER